MNWKRLLCRLTQHTPYAPGDWREMAELRDPMVRKKCQICGCLLKRVVLKSWEKVEAGTGQVTVVEKIRWVALSREEQVAEALMEEPTMSGVWVSSPTNRMRLL